MIDTNIANANVTGNVEMTEEQLAELHKQLDTYYNHAIGYQQGEIGTKARIAWEYYYGRLPEPVTQGSSTWVDRSVWEAVNGTLQELVSVFTSGEDAVRFTAMGQADANAARASTKMVNKVLLRDNPGYNVLHDAFKECLITRNSFVKRYWGKDVCTYNEQYEDVTREELNAYISQVDGEIVEFSAEERVDDQGNLTGTYDASIVYEHTKEGVKVEFIPFEQMLVDPTAVSIKDASYMAHLVRKTKDELIQMGFDPEVVAAISPTASDMESSIISNVRLNNLSPLNTADVITAGDDKADKLYLHENYIKSSVLGYLEIFQVFTIQGQILEVNRVNEMPFDTFTPFPIPGSIWGESVFDITKDIQDLSTTLTRGIIDNIQNANFRRYQALIGEYDRASLLNNRPGGVVEVRTLNAVTPFEHHQLPQGVTDLLSYVESKKEQRTGVSKMTQGLDPAVFKNDNAYATVNMMFTAAQSRLRMVARNIAQRGIMELMISIYDLVRQNGKEPMPIQTVSGEIIIDPKTLPKRDQMIVGVAVGDSERKERAANLQAVLMMFNQIPQMTSMFQPANAYFAGTQVLEAMGIYDVENYMTPLEQVPPPQPDPLQEAQVGFIQAQTQKLAVEGQQVIAEIQQKQSELEFEQIKTADDMFMRKEESMSNQDQMADEMSLREREIRIKERELELKFMELDLKRKELAIEATLEASQGRNVGFGNT